MAPIGLSVSGSTYVLATGQAKFWAILVGVNDYQDSALTALQYAAIDSQSLGEALTEAVQEIPRKQIITHHDFAAERPTLAAVRQTLRSVLSQVNPLDTVLFYFSGHGLLEPESQQVVLCLQDTERDALLETGLAIAELLAWLGQCAAKQQLVWLDACHSGGYSGGYPSVENGDRPKGCPISHLAKILQAYAVHSREFYALLSCQEGQQSWEFPDLGHGLFTYYLIRGLRGEAANSEGVIEADGLYKYVYQHTRQYLDQLNLQLRQLNQQKQQQGLSELYPEYPPQTPKRIVVGMGELILGFNAQASETLSVVTAAQEELQTLQPHSSLMVISQLDAELTQFSGEVTVVGGLPVIELNNQGEVLRFPLMQKIYRLGRDRQWSDLEIPKRGWEVLSRHQAMFHQEGSSYRIYDGNGQTPSRNGIFSNHTRISPTEGYLLQHGSTLEIGQDPHNQILLSYLQPTSTTPGILPSKRRLLLQDLTEFPVILGREPLSRYASMQLDAPVVSRRHATIHRESAGVYRLEDHSTNGTFVNGQAIKRVTLQTGDRIQIGPFILVYRAEVLELYDRGNQIRLDAHHLQRRVKETGDREKTILDDISLAIEPGQLVALVGGSGAGKSTLMKTLLGIEPTTSGAVFLNGDDLRQHFNVYRMQIGYVPQEDIVHADLTVEEVLTYACALRLPPDTDVDAVVKRTLEQTMLSHVRHSFVRDLSGGQRKRVSMGVELLADPRLFFLDEPTSGLDPGLDKEMMKLLRELADQGRTVILVTHATANIEECDRVAFLGRGGKLCYYGPPKAALRFFDMPAEDLKYFADIYRKLDPGTHPQEIQNIIEDWATRFQTSPDYQTYVQAPLSSGEVTGDRKSSPNPVSSSRSSRSRHRILPWRQLSVLSQRYFRLIGRDRTSLILSLLTGPIGIALVWLGVQGKTPLIASSPPDLHQASLALRVVFIFSCVAIWVGLSSAVQEIVKEAAIYVRERLVNLGILPYIGSKVWVRLGIALVQTLLITGAIALGFASPESDLLPWWLGLGITTFLTLVNSLSLGLMLSAFVRNATAANSALPLVMIPQIIFSGVLFDLKGIADWISYAMPSRWSVAAYAALVNVNGMIPNLPTNPQMPALQSTVDPNPVYAATWNNLGQNWSMLVLHALLYLLVTLYLQRRKDVY